MKKIIALIAIASAWPALAQTTLPLSRSTTFSTLQNRVTSIENGTPAKLTGNQYFQNKVCAENSQTFCLSKGAGPYLNFADGAYMQWNPSTNKFEFSIGGSNRVEMSAAGTTFTDSVRLAGTRSFYLGRNNNLPFVAFDEIGSRVEFDYRGFYAFYIGGAMVAKLDGNGTLNLRGSLNQNLGGNCC